MDEFTFDHFSKWIMTHLKEDEHDWALQAMYAAFVDDSEYWARQDWRTLYDACKRFEAR